jgi:5-methyltetrahydrofolate--homocysteine methyltransferase
VTADSDDPVLALIAKFVEEGNAPRTKALVEEALAGGRGAWDILNRGIMPALRVLGVGLKDGCISLAEVMISVGAVKAGLSVLEPLMIRNIPTGKGIVIIGTVFGDVHSLGKDLVITMLKGSGFRVIDLGADVAPARFIESVTKHQAEIVALSGLLTSSRLAMRDTIATLKEAGLRDRVSIIVGGGAVDRQSAQAIGADAYGEDAAVAPDLILSLVRAPSE